LKIYVVGIGPGNIEEMTPRARKAIESSDVIVGYSLYVDLVRDLCRDKEILSSGMRQEVDRCKQVLEQAKSGKTVALLSSGDAGVYGMAGIMLEVCENDPDISVEIVPGITAAMTSGAILGAPITHDFAVISLSDLLTPWEKIEKRLSLASEADFVIAIYNPKSIQRQDHLTKAVSLMMAHKDGDTPCGYVRNAGREQEASGICKLSELPHMDIDMLTTIIVGNSQTRSVNGRLVTPRGYTRK
jgi:precorrin-3B C17-methyltransferase